MKNINFGELPKIKIENKIRTCEISNDSKNVAILDEKYQIHIFNIEQNKKTNFLVANTYHNKDITAGAFDNAGKLFATGDINGLLNIWSLENL